jgi:spermidine synthase
MGKGEHPVQLVLKTYITETVSDHQFITYIADEVLFLGESPYQKIQVFSCKPFGRILMLDQAVQFTEADEFIYHEMLGHVPVLAHPAPRNVLVVGGGDGGAAREVLRHEEVERLELCEIDQMVVDVCRKYFPSVASSFDDPRFHLHLGDGVARLKELPEGSQDVILVDGTDPNPVSLGLYSEDFYRHVARALGPQGVFGTLAGSPFFHEGWTIRVHHELRKVFPQVALYLATIPTYPGFLWAFCVATKEQDPTRLADPSRLERLEPKLRYLNRDVFAACFALPNFVRRLLEEPAS